MHINAQPRLALSLFALALVAAIGFVPVVFGEDPATDENPTEAPHDEGDASSARQVRGDTENRQHRTRNSVRVQTGVRQRVRQDSTNRRQGTTTEHCAGMRAYVTVVADRDGVDSEAYVAAKTAYSRECTGQQIMPPAKPIDHICAHIDARITNVDEGSTMYDRLLQQQAQCAERMDMIATCRERHTELRQTQSGSAEFGQARAAFASDCLRSPRQIVKVARTVAPRGACVSMRARMVAAAHKEGRDTEAFAELKSEFQAECNDDALPVLTVEDPALTEEDAEDLASPFSDTRDLPAVHMFARGIFSGVGTTGRFQGDLPTNRAQVAKVLFRACGLPEEEGEDGDSTLSDVPAREWFAPFVRAAMKRNIIGGYPDGTFRPGNIVTRAEFAKMFVRACGMEEDLPHGFSDVQEGEWFAQFAGAVERYNMLPDAIATGLFEGATPMTRQELAIAIDAWLRNRVE